MKTQIFVDNIKCSGCAATIQKELKGFPEVNSIVVDPDQDMVEVDFKDPAILEKVKLKLSHLGYPVKGTLKGLDKVAAGVKSYVSCAVGRMGE